MAENKDVNIMDDTADSSTSQDIADTVDADQDKVPPELVTGHARPTKKISAIILAQNEIELPEQTGMMCFRHDAELDRLPQCNRVLIVPATGDEDQCEQLAARLAALTDAPKIVELFTPPSCGVPFWFDQEIERRHYKGHTVFQPIWDDMTETFIEEHTHPLHQLQDTKHQSSTGTSVVEPNQRYKKRPQINFGAIPKSLKDRNQWVLWRFESRGKTKTTKVPIQLNGRYAESNNPATWSDFQSCRAAYVAGGFDGLGFAFAEGDELAGIDLDHCIDDDGRIEPWAQAIVDQFGPTYIEKSPSGHGIHIWCRGNPLKTGQKTWKKAKTELKQALEVYDFTSPRYLTVTGNAMSEQEISSCQPGLDWLFQEYFAPHYDEPTQSRSQGEIDVGLVCEALSYIPADDYATWVQIGMASKNGGLDVDVWDNWSAKSSKYAAGVCAKKWTTFNSARIGLGTIFHLAKANGFRFPARRNGESLSRTTDGASPDWTNPETFGELILFGEVETPEIKSTFLPAWIKAYVEAVAEQTQTPVAMAAMLVLAVLAACLQKRYEVSPHGDGYTEPLSLWVLVAMPPASRKTAVLQALYEPISEWERERVVEVAPLIAEQQTKRDISMRRIDELSRRASKQEY